MKDDGKGRAFKHKNYLFADEAYEIEVEIEM